MLQKIQAISDPTRFAILELVRDRELPAGEIAGHFSMSRPAISQHLRVLKENELVRERREGTRRFYRIRSEGFRDIQKFLESFWAPRLDKLKELTEQAEREKK